MEGHAYLGELLASVVYLAVAVRLLRLGQRTGEVPEKLLGVVFLFTAMSAGLYLLTGVPQFESLWTPLNFAGRVTYFPVAITLAVFTRRVFRPENRWGRWLVWATAILFVVGVGGSARGGDWEGFSISNGWFWLEWIGYTLPFGWASSEAFAQYRKARRRVRLGLCDPHACNRFLLWSLFGAIQVCTSMVTLGQYANYETTNQFTAAWDALYGFTQIAALVMIWLAFFAPDFYQRWINGITPVEKVEEG